ncbi:MAG: regulatory protein [Patescibacteria group bacterium]|nr:regulatory protein [Patescibacteria group bacterium]
MRITDIKQQVKRKTRYSIYVDDKYSFSLSETELMKSCIRIGRDYNAEELEELQQTAVLDKAFMRSLDYLARRPRSEWEVRDYLKRKEYDSPTIDTILNKLSDYDYIDDAKFAQAWITNRRLLKPTSLRRLRQELIQKHVSKEVIEAALTEDEGDETASLKEVIEKKRSQSRYQDPQKLIAYLLRQGYNYGDIKDALQSTTED